MSKIQEQHNYLCGQLGQLHVNKALIELQIAEVTKQVMSLNDAARWQEPVPAQELPVQELSVPEPTEAAPNESKP